MNGKRIAAFVLAAVLLLGCLCGCGKKENAGQTGAQKQDGTAQQSADPALERGKYAFATDYFEMPENVSRLYGLGVSGDTAYVAAQTTGGVVMQTRSFVDGEGKTFQKEVAVSVPLNAVFEVDLKSGAVKEAAQFRLPQLPEDWEGQVSVCDLHCAPDGSLWVSIKTEATRYELPEDFDPATGDKVKYAVAESALELYHFSPSGEQLAAFPVNMDKSENGRFFLSAEGLPMRRDLQSLYIYQPDGTVKQIDCQSSMSMDADMLLIGGSRTGLIYRKVAPGGAGEEELCAAVDTGAGTLGAGTPVPGSLNDWHSGNAEYDLLWSGVGSSVVSGYKFSDGSSTKLFDWIDCGIEKSNLLRWEQLPDGRIVAMSGSIEYLPADHEQVVLLTPVDPATVQEKTILTAAGYLVDNRIRQKIMDFNRTSKTHQIVLTDYYDVSTGKDASIQRLNTVVLSGSVPDLFIGSDVPIARYAAAGLLTDLYPLIDADPNLQRSDLMSEVLTALEVGGHLYQLPMNFGVSTALAVASVADSYSTWTVDDVLDARKQLPEGATIFSPLYTRSDALRIVLEQVGSFIDWENKTCSFNNDSFRGLLRFVYAFPKDEEKAAIQEQYLMGSDVDMSLFDEHFMLANGRQLMLPIDIAFINSYIAACTGYPQETRFVGYPSEDGSFGTSFSTSGDIAISTACADKDAAWSFVSSLLTPEFMDTKDMITNFPILRSSMEKCCQDVTEYHYEQDANGEPILDANGNPIMKAITERSNIVNQQYEPDYAVLDTDGSLLEALKPGSTTAICVYRVRQSDIDRLWDLISRTKRAQSTDPMILDIIKEECTAYFADEKSVEQTADLIQNRVNVYLMEMD